MKKSILMSLMLALAITNANAYEELAGFDGPTWYDYRATSYAGGNGNENNPYLISTPEQLAKLAYDVNVNGAEGYYKLTAKISLNKREDGERVLWVPIGISEDKPFKGTLTNPDGYVIEDMKIKANSIETTSCFGLFGNVTGTVDGIKLEEGEITVSGFNDAYWVGLLCGKMNKCTIKNCTVQGHIEAAVNSSNGVKIGGLIGENVSDIYMEEHGRVQSCVARTEIILTGNSSNSVSAGGVFGESYGKILDCHAVTDMTVSGLSTSNNSHIGGVIGYMGGGPMKYCSASGDIKVDATSHAMTGGLIGTMRQVVNQGNDFNVKFCATTVTVSGGYTLGGLIGYCYVMNINFMNLNLVNNVSSSYVDARDATNAGGIIGHLENNRQYPDTNILLADGSSSDFFCGTIAKPKSSKYYGTIIGRTSYVNDSNFSKLWGFVFYYSPMMCNLQSNGMGKTLGSQTGLYGTLSRYSGKLPNGAEGYYGSYGVGWGGGLGSLGNPAPAALSDVSADRVEMCFTDNYVLCDLLFYITSDKQTLYSASDVTIDFTIEDFTNDVTGERKAVFTVPDDVECLKVVDKHLYPLDPGEVVVTIMWNGLQRKVHLDITYGEGWNGGSNNDYDHSYNSDGTEYSDGSAEKPYLIHSADQLNGVLKSENYNKAGVHFKLTNDIFFNTHLLQDDGTPRSDAIAWEPFNFKGHLDGNGKTIYGLYVNKSSLDDGESLGFFKNLYGTVRNLAIVDSNVSTNEVSNPNSFAGLLCGTLKEGASVSNCLFHGRVSTSSYCGGIAGRADGTNTSITDCFANVHVTYPASSPQPFTASGICANSPAAMEYCFSTGRAESFIYNYGISDGAGATCHYDKQMQARNDFNQEIGSTTAEILSGNLMGGSNAWQQDDERYPMLKTFADTPYGKLLAMPVLFDGTDKAGDVNYIFEFPIEDVSWSALHDQTYIDVINDCGAASIVEKTDNDVEILIAQAENVESQCTRAMRTLPLNLRSGLTNFRFKDNVAQTAAKIAFDKNKDEILTLRELVLATKDDFDVFNREATGLKWFPEFRYFTSTTILQEGMLSGLDQLCELQLPKKLVTIEANAFNGCSSLDSITMPQTFTTLEMGGLYGSGIKKLLVNNKHPNMQSIDGALFKNESNGKHLVAYPPGRGEESATISTVFHYIDDYAFYKIPNLKNIYIDNCLPEGNYVDADAETPIVPEDGTEILEIYVNDGSYGSIGSSYGSLLFPKYEDESSFWSYYYEGHLHIYYPLNMTSAGWATLYIGFPTQLPEGFNAYVVTVSDDDAKIAKLKNIGRVIPKTTPVVIKNAAGLAPGIYPLTCWEGAVPNVPKYDNRFVGSYIGQEGKWGLDVNQETSITGGVLTLGRNSKGVVGFYKYNGAVIPPYRAYLTTNTVIEGAKGFTFVIDDTIDEMPTSIQNAPSIREEQSSVYYDMTGRALQGTPTRPGVYIRNGKRIVVK